MDWERLSVFLIIIAFFVLLIASMGLAHAADNLIRSLERGPDNLVRSLERREGVSPGQTKVLPECGCTVRYVGTVVHGHRYTVILDRLD